MIQNQPRDVLLVEDSDADLELALRALKTVILDHQIQVARDGVEALEFLFQPDAAGGLTPKLAPKVILLDLKLPRLDGLEVLRRVKGDPRTRVIPVVMLTSSVETRDVVESYQLGANSYVAKPVDFESFVAAVHELSKYWLFLNQPVPCDN